MKQLTCEMCGSTDLVKQDGMYVCQSCATKYSVEEAKKLMIEGTVDVSGSEVKIDSSKQLENLRTLAHRAQESSDSKSAAKYFEEILLADPDDWEANFYSVLYSSFNCTLGQMGQSALRVGNCLDSVFALIVQQYSAEKIAQEQSIADLDDENSRVIVEELRKVKVKNAYMDVFNRTVNFATMLVSNMTGHMGSTDEMINESINKWHVPLAQTVVMLGDGLIRYFEDFDTAEKAYGMGTMMAKILSRTSAGREMLKVVNNRMAELLDLKRNKEQKKVEAYWAEHAEEKADLEQEKASLNQLVKEAEAQFQAIPEHAVAKELTSKINALNAEQKGLGLFKSKERKALQEQIDALSTELSSVQEHIRKAKDETVKRTDSWQIRIQRIGVVLSSVPQ